MNKYQKGRRNERKARDYYVSLGYDVEIVRYDKWMKNKDFFGLWDLICVGEKDMRFVQVKTNAKPTRKWIDEARAWGPDKTAIHKEYVVYKDYQRGCVPSTRVTLHKSY